MTRRLLPSLVNVCRAWGPSSPAQAALSLPFWVASSMRRDLLTRRLQEPAYRKPRLLQVRTCRRAERHLHNCYNPHVDARKRTVQPTAGAQRAATNDLSSFEHALGNHNSLDEFKSLVKAGCSTQWLMEAVASVRLAF